jgi:Circadian oscillating protein COP23
MTKRLTGLDELKKVARLFCLAASFTVLSPISFVSASERNVNKFTCVENSSGVWTTRMKFRGSSTQKDIINYVERHFELSGYTPEVRCREITYRLNEAVSSAIERNKVRELVLKNSYLNGYGVICVAESANGKCKENEVLITLKPGKSAYQSINKMITALKADQSTDVYQERGCRKQECKVISVKLYPLLTR